MMKREQFQRLVEQALVELPARYRELLENVLIVVEDYPRHQHPPRRRPPPQEAELLMGEFYGIPRTQKSVFAPGPPDQVFLYQKNIEAICATEEEVRTQVRLTLLHELGHYFGLKEDELNHL
jgi:predicted Zn-dependent protease with MMP-like domain